MLNTLEMHFCYIKLCFMIYDEPIKFFNSYGQSGPAYSEFFYDFNLFNITFNWFLMVFTLGKTYKRLILFFSPFLQNFYEFRDSFGFFLRTDFKMLNIMKTAYKANFLQQE